jgi:hypothetical protein
MPKLIDGQAAQDSTDGVSARLLIADKVLQAFCQPQLLFQRVEASKPQYEHGEHAQPYVQSWDLRSHSGVPQPKSELGKVEQLIQVGSKPPKQ